MKVCIPIVDERGLNSPVSLHFGSAPYFLLVDQETGENRMVSNANQHHEHGRCQPLATLGNEEIDCIAVAGIGRGALTRLLQAGISVHLARPGTALECLRALESGSLPEFEPAAACGGHGNGHGHRHGAHP